MKGKKGREAEEMSKEEAVNRLTDLEIKHLEGKIRFL